MRPPPARIWAASAADGDPAAGSSMTYRGADGSAARTARAAGGVTGPSEQDASTLAEPAAATRTSRPQIYPAGRPRIPYVVVIRSKLRGCTHAVKPLCEVRR